MNTNIYSGVEDVRSVLSGPERMFFDCEKPTSHRYAWLENEAGFWCLITNPFADPSKAKRYWKNEEKALNELEEEGWQVVNAYPRDPRLGLDCCINGYGLRRTIH